MITLRRRLLGLAALLAIFGIIIGLPTVLLAVEANPFAGGLPTFEAIKTALTSPDDGTLAVMVCRILSEDYPTPTPTEALQRKVAAPVGAYLQIVRRQELQAEADRLANLGQLTPVFWSDDADTPAEGTPCKRH